MTEKRFIYCFEGIEDKWETIEEYKYTPCTKDGFQDLCDMLNELNNENEQLKKELKIYERIATCSNCKYQDYDWFEDGDEFEICKKGNNNQQIEYHICKEWEEF